RRAGPPRRDARVHRELGGARLRRREDDEQGPPQAAVRHRVRAHRHAVRRLPRHRRVPGPPRQPGVLHPAQGRAHGRQQRRAAEGFPVPRRRRGAAGLPCQPRRTCRLPHSVGSSLTRTVVAMFPAGREGGGARRRPAGVAVGFHQDAAGARAVAAEGGAEAAEGRGRRDVLPRHR
uniref:Uncharacterized protein n=1 Tax=Oryza brachyantha TaxID=4533 RepID=J3LSH1_ORYBR